MSNQEVRKGEELPAVKLKQFLQENHLIGSIESELFVKQFTHGYSNLTYLLSIENKEYVLRKPPIGAIKRGHDMSREFKVQSAVKKEFSKVPKMFAYTDDAAVLGSEFYIMEKVEGIILNFKEAKKRDIPANDYKTIANAWLDTFTELHQLDYDAIGLTNLGKPEGYVERQVTNWGKQYLKAATKDVPSAEKVMQWMQENQPKNYQHCLIHNDYKYDNVVFKDNSWKEITAVLDWEMATLGDPLMDLGTSLGYWTLASDHDFVKQGIPSPTIFEGNPMRSEIVASYAKKSGRDIHNMVFYYVFGLFKIAVIAQQIYYRYSKGLTSDPRFANLDKAAELCCNLALKSIKTNSID
ncbi:phosphotransferase family protein [bacterium]|jgi:aminoglycoside phosphotransferase (APT) family kinase protein|nr:phosphotransferase family protein [bacterium]MDA9327899.1 phosphotransferase family protein [Flavobacteriaceae bacterium]MDA9338269.1 phosphotransferase family protein [Flavobacteriaceae bacterium]MDA9353953.1 phosphotransferase family protein [Flavobacteriaceae bacterium]MDA9773139.1 phosphotransferase family protein [Flavobacteriaceae bacterium]|tara:strand:- start:3490 stop:4548 length:1059 start_codon:yes stop_codon:yes gene_type:complete